MFEFLYSADLLTRAGVLLLVIILLYCVYKFVLHAIAKSMLETAKTKRQKDRIIVFSHMVTYIFYALVALAVIFFFTGSLTGFGISAGLLSAALGWALQRPITGVAAWVMVVAKKPFEIGDRVVIGDVKGDVTDISLTHIYLAEVGGTVGAEEVSGRIIMLPNSLLFEQKIINYTFHDEFILDEIIMKLTYDSDIDLAKKICLDSAVKFTHQYKNTRKPYVAVSSADWSVNITVRYMVDAVDRVSAASRISEMILKDIKKTKGKVKTAFPVTYVKIEK